VSESQTLEVQESKVNAKSEYLGSIASEYGLD
jgi:hypothetical protein